MLMESAGELPDVAEEFKKIFERRDRDEFLLV